MISDDVAIDFVMFFYNVSKEDALVYYKDEIDAYKRLGTKFYNEHLSTGHRNNNT